jgi:RimJ/RimL family protein N-acetyltransferase
MDDGPIVVRPATPRDVVEFLAMYRTVAAELVHIRTEDVPFDARHYRGEFRRSWTEAGAHIVATAGDRFVGALGAHREEHPIVRHVATFGMFVAPSWRGRGAGSALVRELFRWAREFGVEKIELSVYPGNEAAIALYRKFGFVDEGRLVRHSRKSYGYEDEILMAGFVEEQSGTETV